MATSRARVGPESETQTDALQIAHHVPPLRTTDAQKRLLTYMNAAALVLHLLNASLGTTLVKSGNPRVPAIAPLFEYVTHGSSGAEFFMPMPKTIFRVGALDGLLTFAWITAFFHILYLWQLHSPWYAKAVMAVLGGGGVNPLRWVEYSITAGIMAAFGNLTVGISDFYLFLKVLCSNVAVQTVGYILEILDHRDPLHKRVAGILWVQAFVLNFVNVAILLYQVFASSTHTYVFYYNVVPYAILFQTFGIVASKSFNKTGFFRSDAYAEMWYIGLSLGTKFAVFWLGFSTYRGLEEARGFAPKTAGVNWDAVRYIASYGPMSAMLAAAAYEYERFKRVEAAESGKTKEPTLAGSKFKMSL